MPDQPDEPAAGEDGDNALQQGDNEDIATC